MEYASVEPFITSPATAAGTDVIQEPVVPLPTFFSLAYRTALLRDQVDLTKEDVIDLDHKTRLAALDELTAVIALEDPNELLESLGRERGLSWTIIAKLVGVSDTAVRKWRRGEAITPENRRRLAHTAAFLQQLEATFPVPDPASWLEMRVSEDATVTAADLFAESHPDLLFDLAGRRLTPYQVLDAFDPDWRRDYGVDERFVVTEGYDGEVAISERQRDGG